ncbi:hypothetical protein [Salinisphaera orenii]|uniref:Uncharacterized protein n=1 Tax=Salinisphaera orenii YIM 95161 TaxID=1051139 RepID=A0A423PMH2_9GAMM|nr:hypothetical protein [Salinisphaera halophila]ROO26778.1 hypothetical protein SAHL_12450 [Salinisphaera halophila YIM 95161]
MTDQSEPTIPDLVAAALAFVRTEPDDSLYLAETALSEAEAEVARLERSQAEERAAMARRAMHTLRDASAHRADGSTCHEDTRGRVYCAFHIRQAAAKSATQPHLDRAREVAELARAAYRHIENAMQEHAPELVALH